MKTFNKNELKTARKIIKELNKKSLFIYPKVHIATITIKAIDILTINEYGSRKLTLSSLTEDEQNLARAIAFFYGYFIVVMDDFDFNSSAVTKMIVKLLKSELLEKYVEPDETHSESLRTILLTILVAMTFSAGVQNLTKNDTSWQLKLSKNI